MSLLSGLACVCVLISRSALVGAQPGSSGQPSQVAAAEAKQGSPPARQATAAAEVTVAPVGPLGEAQALYLRGDFEGATRQYRQLLQEQPKSAEAYAGLTRVYLKSKDVERASETVNHGVEMADSPPVRVALGEVLFRQGKIAAAEQEWVKVINSGHPISDHAGTEISGTLGFTPLRLLDIKIDYRDGLVDFGYDAKRWGQ